MKRSEVWLVQASLAFGKYSFKVGIEERRSKIKYIHFCKLQLKDVQEQSSACDYEEIAPFVVIRYYNLDPFCIIVKK